MYVMNRCIAALGVVAAVSLVACSGGSEVVVRVRGAPITKATLDHWISIEAIVSSELFPRKPAPRGVVPDPPGYTACIAYLRSLPAVITGGRSKPAVAQLKSRCRRRYKTLRQYVLEFLIGAEWTLGEGAELGVRPTDAEARQRLKQVNKRYFPREADFKRYLSLTGQTLSDEMFRSKVQLLEVKLPQMIAPKGLTAQQQRLAYAKLSDEYTKKWTARTSCRPGYIVSKCKQYKAP
jgi:foldase protein PrsA